MRVGGFPVLVYEVGGEFLREPLRHFWPPAPAPTPVLGLAPAPVLASAPAPAPFPHPHINLLDSKQQQQQQEKICMCSPWGIKFLFLVILGWARFYTKVYQK